MSDQKTVVSAIQPAYPINVDRLRSWMNEPGALLFLDQLEARMFAKEHESGAALVSALMKSALSADGAGYHEASEAIDCIKMISLFEAMRTGQYDDGQEFPYLQVVQQVTPPTP